MKCIFDGHCKIDINTRRFCPYCRLKQCFAAGMKKELILGIIFFPYFIFSVSVVKILCIVTAVRTLCMECYM